MKETVKVILKILLRLALAVLVVLAGLFAYLMLSMSEPPLYLLRAGGVAIAGTCFVLGLLCLGVRGKARRFVLWGLLAVLLGSAAYAAVLWSRERVPTVSDRGLMLSEYMPFASDTKAAYLKEESALRLEGEALPRLDGATALYPVYAAFVQAAYPRGEYPVSGYSPAEDAEIETVLCTGTEEAYDRLIRGEADIIFVGGPSREQRTAAREAGLELRLTPIGREAFVFFVNSRNPVTGLTVEEIRGIYAGRIIDWRQVGGRARKIRPFQRRANSGSQTAMEALMAGEELLEPEKRERIDSMMGIISSVADYQNFRNAIGYSFRFYATEMDGTDQIRLLAVNGAAPTVESIRDGSYPLVSEFYAVTALPAGEEEPEEVRAFLDWMVSPQGQWLVEHSGYVGMEQ